MSSRSATKKITNNFFVTKEIVGYEIVRGELVFKYKKVTKNPCRKHFKLKPYHNPVKNGSS